MLSRTLPIAMLVAFVAAAPLATAVHPTPPAGYSCVGGYNPSAYMNACYDITTPSATIGEATSCYYVLGNLPGCVTYPWLPVSAEVAHVFVQGPLCNPGNHYVPIYCHTVAA